MDSNLSNPSPVYQLAEDIVAYFNDEDLRDLCFRLRGVDYENLESKGKRGKVRDLVNFMERHRRLDELAETVKVLRPHIGINIQKLASETLAADDPRLNTIRSLIDQFRNYYEKLSEWKELHNHLDETINVFDQYSAQVERLATKGESIDIDQLTISWKPVSRRVEKMLHWGEHDIKYVGTPYKVMDDGGKTGEKWAVEIGELHKDMELQLQKVPETESEINKGRWQRMLSNLGDGDIHKDLWQAWWRDLRNLTRQFEDTIKTQMYLADKELRKTAADLHDLSKEALWG